MQQCLECFNLQEACPIYNILNNTTKREKSTFNSGDSPTHFYTKLSQLAGAASCLIVYNMDMENGDSKGLIVEKEHHHNGRTTPQNVSSTSILRKKSDPMLVSNIRFKMLRQFLANLQEVILGTKLAVLFPAVPLAIVADMYDFGRVSACHSRKTGGYIHQDRE